MFIGRLLLILIILAPVAEAQDGPAITESDLLEKAMFRLIPVDQDIDIGAYGAFLRVDFRTYDRDRSGFLDAEDMVMSEKLDHVNNRASAYSYAAQFDVDGDWIITRDEVALTLLNEVTKSALSQKPADLGAYVEERLQERVDNRMGGLPDLDGDGEVTFEEVYQDAMTTYPADRTDIVERLGQHFSTRRFDKLDADGDGKTTEAEYVDPFVAKLQSYDSDGNGLVDQTERLALIADMERVGLPLDRILPTK